MDEKKEPRPDELPDPEAGPTETDEEDVLRALFGEPDEGGVYRGEG